MNTHVMFVGNLVGDVKTNTNEQGKKYAFGKIAVYNGKNKQGEKRDSMFFDFVVFGRDAEDLEVTGLKGTPIIVCGNLEEDKSVSQTDGKTYINKRVVCNLAKALVKVQRESNGYDGVQDPFAQ